MARWRGCALVALLAGCAAERPPGPASPLADPGPGYDVMLFRDGASVLDRRWRAIPAGRSVVDIEPVPRRIVPGSATLVSRSDPAGLRVLGLEGGTGGPRLAWTVEAARAGEHLLEASYITEGFSWDAEYRVVLQGDGEPARVRGHVMLHNQTRADMPGARVHLVDTEMVLYASGADRPQIVTILRAVDLPARGSTRYSLFRARWREVPVRERLVFDGVGTPIHDNPERRPVAEPDYVAEARRPPVQRRLELPAGEGSSFYSAPGGFVTAVGDDARGPVDGHGIFVTGDERVIVHLGPCEGVTGTRRQSDFFYDAGARRLVEEFRIELENRTQAPEQVVVREHLYRGVQWTIAYHNAARAAKEGPQQVRFVVDVPAGDSALVMYRVVYTW